MLFRRRRPKPTCELTVGAEHVCLDTDVLCSHSTMVYVHAGKRIITAGAYGFETFVLEQGVASVHAAGSGRFLGTVAHHEVFGELSVLLQRPRAADVVANTDLMVRVATPNELSALMGQSEELADALWLRSMLAESLAP